MNVVFVCSGTAGHVNPALAIANELKNEQANILFIGAGRDMENKLVGAAGFDLVNIKMSGLMRKPSLKMIAHNIKTVKNLLSAKRAVLEIFDKFQPDVVIGTGGYVCYPVIKAASKRKIPAVIHESNVSPGLSIKLLSATVDNVLTSFPEVASKYKKPERVIYTGTPVLSKSIGEKKNPPRETTASGKPLIVSFWGSLGARRMNDMMPQFIQLLIKDGSFRLIHAAGTAGDAERIKEKTHRLTGMDTLPDYVEVRQYIDDMPDVLSAADIALCRAGGATIGEIIAYNKPSVLIPSPYVSNNEQEENALWLEQIGAAVVLQEKNCNGEVLYKKAASILGDKSKCGEMSKALSTISRPDAASFIADYVISLANKHKAQKQQSR